MKFILTPSFEEAYTGLTEDEAKLTKVMLFKLGLERGNFNRMAEKLPGKAGKLDIYRCRISDMLFATVKLQENTIELRGLGRG